MYRSSLPTVHSVLDTDPQLSTRNSLVVHSALDTDPQLSTRNSLIHIVLLILGFDSVAASYIGQACARERIFSAASVQCSWIILCVTNLML